MSTPPAHSGANKQAEPPEARPPRPTLEALPPQRNATWWGMLLGIVALMIICFLWEIWLAPLRPGGTWLALKALPLLLPLLAVWQHNLYRLQLSSILIWLYFTEGVVRGFSDRDALSSMLGWGETAAVTLFFICAILYIRPYKKAAKQAAKQAANQAANQAAHSTTDPT
jgi:uncharacterized membrane protein